MFTFLKKVFSPFTKMGSKLGQKIRDLFAHPVDEALFNKLERLLYEADLGPDTATTLTARVRTFLQQGNDPSGVIPFLAQEILSYFPPRPANTLHTPPHVILLVGINGSGKTTTLAKLAYRFAGEKKKVLIAAGDTFRAAAQEQLGTWALRVGVECIQSQAKGDPSAVAFDALSAAVARGSDIVLIDTAGRLQTKHDLMQELGKIGRVCKKVIPDAPHETLFVVDATIGQNALDQAKAFHAVTPLTGVVLTKLDGTARGGIAVQIAQELNIPILWVGLGEAEDDLIPFDPAAYVNALLQQK
ncbi:MAG: cell division protein ftsY [Chlamydiota bacterium]